MKRLIVALAAPALVAAFVMAAGCASLATPEAPSSGSPSPGATSAAAVSQQVKDGAALYVAFACIRCHSPNGVGGVPNRLNVGGDDTIPALNNIYRDPSEQFHNAVQITQVMYQGSILSHKPGVINMPSWKGVINQAQANAIAAYILAGFPQVPGVAYDANPAAAGDIYTAFACITCHGQVGANASPLPAPNPLSPDKAVPLLRNPADDVTIADMRATILDGSIPPPGKTARSSCRPGVRSSRHSRSRRSCPTSRTGPRAPSCRRPRRRRRCRWRAARPRRAPRPQPRRVRDEAGMIPSSLLGQIPLSPPLSVRLIALVVIEVVLLVLVVALYMRYDQLKKIPVDEWWERRRRAGVSPRVDRMMRESHEQYLAEQREAAESGLLDAGESRPAAPDRPEG